MPNQLHSFQMANYQLNIVVAFVIETMVLDNFSQMKKNNNNEITKLFANCVHDIKQEGKREILFYHFCCLKFEEKK